MTTAMSTQQAPDPRPDTTSLATADRRLGSLREVSGKKLSTSERDRIIDTMPERSTARTVDEAR
ncbi:hypothetical protein [Microbacterium ulmi]|uniref:Uncharacterized protein n=1 Tax=Microbacterium ulmi TaxID=179095 RepID=A0A7Y2M2E7_9MICO|nr:hypothetical protein [Microbacterium ulmi]NII69534.1 hypothetical protein [Microbacterium ulmi]NNH05077.1 hypothetical protein [Microbacterium ulmi]